MSTNKPPDTVKRLIDSFDHHANWYKSSDYKEAQLRQEFLNPFFEALGWDVYNKLGFAPHSQQVIHEDSLRMGGTTKAPDYSFRVGGRRFFFVEAKAPAHNLCKDPSPAFQLRRYAWTAKLPLSLLTDFEELGVYDTRIRPVRTDKPHKARLRYLTYHDYADQWEFLLETFSPVAVQQGALDKLVYLGPILVDIFQ